MPLHNDSTGQPDDGLGLTATAVASAPIGFAAFDAQLRCLTVNSALARMCHSNRSALLGLELDSALPAELGKNCRPAIAAAIREGRITENLEVGPFGGAAPDSVWLCNISPIIDTESDTIAAGLWMLDVTERTRAMEDLLETERRFRRLTDNARDIIYRMALPARQFEYVSPACQDVLGYPPQMFYDSPERIAQLVHPDSREYFERSWEGLTEGQIPDSYEYKIIDTSGRTRWLHQRVVVVRDDGGEPVAIEGVVTDVSEARRAEKALREHEQNLRALASKLTLTEEDVRRRVAQDLHDGVAQALVGTRYYLSRLGAVSDDGRRRELMQAISDQVDAAIEDCRSIALDLSSPILHEHGLGHAIELMAKRAASRCRIECTVTGVETDLGLSDRFKIALFQALRELLHNVEKHARATEILIAISRTTDQVTIRFRDNGVGCEGPQLAMPPPDGGGFGLFAIREHIGFLGGSVEISCAPGQGCEVTLSVPAEAQGGR